MSAAPRPRGPGALTLPPGQGAARADDETDIAVLPPLPESPAADDPRFDQQPLLDDHLDLVVPRAHHPDVVRIAVRGALTRGAGRV